MASNALPIRRLLISLYHKDPLDRWAPLLQEAGVEVYSTGGTLQRLRQLGVAAQSVEALTGFPAVLGGRVKTLHPAVMGGVLMDETRPEHVADARTHGLIPFDAVVVDLYPFREAVQQNRTEAEIQELIDIGGITLIRAAAKNYPRVYVVPDRQDFARFEEVLHRRPLTTTLDERRRMAARAFAVSAAYDVAIARYLGDGRYAGWIGEQHLPLRYGENPHQEAAFYRYEPLPWIQHHGKPLSYNNLLDLHHALELLHEWVDTPAFAVIKHTNACGVAVASTIESAVQKALAGDPLSAFGGVLVSNRPLSGEAVEPIARMFFEVIWAPGYDAEALRRLAVKKRVVLEGRFPMPRPQEEFRTALGGVLWQSPDAYEDDPAHWEVVTERRPTPDQWEELKFAWKVVKHLKSNAVALVQDRMLIGAGHGQTSRVDAVEYAVAKAAGRGHAVEGSVAASDAFFPFADGVERLAEAGVAAVIQPGGSIRDAEVVEACNRRGVAMVVTRRRHFKH